MKNVAKVSLLPRRRPTLNSRSADSLCQLNQELSIEERNLLSVAYKNVIGARRASWRIVSSIEGKEDNKSSGSSQWLTLIKGPSGSSFSLNRPCTIVLTVCMLPEYRVKIEKELENICDDILAVLNDHLLKAAESGESKVFYAKVCHAHIPLKTWR